MTFFAVPCARRLEQDRKPDVRVHPVPENVDTMKDILRDAVLAAMESLSLDHLMSIHSGEWSLLPRARYWFATFPNPRESQDVFRVNPQRMAN